MRTLGLDEAGRGPVIGPLVVAGVLVDEQERLQQIGVRDSKALSRGGVPSSPPRSPGSPRSGRSSSRRKSSRGT